RHRSCTSCSRNLDNDLPEDERMRTGNSPGWNSHRHHGFIPVLALVLVLALVPGGCGGGGDQPANPPVDNGGSGAGGGGGDDGGDGDGDAGGDDDDGDDNGDDGGNKPPAFTSAASSTFPENGTGTVHTLAADDPDNDPVTFALAGGPDAGAFVVDAANGTLGFAISPDFEAPADADGDNLYVVEVEASDGKGGS